MSNALVSELAVDSLTYNVHWVLITKLSIEYIRGGSLLVQLTFSRKDIDQWPEIVASFIKFF